MGSDSLQKWLKENGFVADRLKSKKGYRILEVRR
jgi:ribosomal protein L34